MKEKFRNGEYFFNDMIREIDEIIDNLTIQQAYWEKKKQEFKEELEDIKKESK